MAPTRRLAAFFATYGRRLFSAFFLRILGALSTVAMTAALTHTLPSSQAGLFLLGTTFVTILAAISSLGLNQTILRFAGASAAGANWHEVNSAYRFALQFTALAAILSATLLFLSANLSASLLEKPQMAVVLGAIAPAVIGVTLLTIHARALQATSETARSILILNILAPLLLCAFLLTLQPVSAQMVAGYYSLATLITAGIGLWLWWRHSWARWPPKILQPLWHSCLPLWIATITSQLVLWSGQLVAGFFITATSYAYLGVSHRVSILVSFILIVVNMVLVPRFAALWSQRKLAELERLSQTATWATLSISLVIVGPLFVFSEDVLNLFGTEYAEATIVLRILLVGQLVNAATGSVAQLLVVTGHETDIRNITVVAGFSSVIIAFALTFSFGLLGAAVATALAIALQNIACFYYVRKRLGFSTLTFGI